MNYSASIASFFSLANCQGARISINVTHLKIKGVCCKMRLLGIAKKLLLMGSILGRYYIVRLV